MGEEKNFDDMIFGDNKEAKTKNMTQTLKIFPIFHATLKV